MGLEELEDLVYKTIRPDTMPNHKLTVGGFFRIISYCLLKQDNKLDEVMSHLT